MSAQSSLSKLSASKPLRRAVPLIFYALLVIFLVLYLHDLDWAKLKHVHVSWWYVAVASVAGLAARYWQVVVWLNILHNLGAKGLKPHRRHLAYVYAKSWMGRYIPGTAPWILGKVYFASKHGIPKEKLGVSSLLEGALEIVTLLVLSFLMLLSDTRFDVINGSTRIFMAVAIAVCVIAMVPAVFNRLVSFAYRLLRRKTLATEHLASPKTILSGAGLYVISSILSGLSLFFIAKCVYLPLSYHDILFVMGASNLAGALGMLAIFAPSGIGVREGVQLVLLSALMPKSIALVIVVVSRLWSVAMDFAFFGCSQLVLRLAPEAKQTS
jgi:uncharacterized membrane protein YbhN (UPF0104 family)